ncbi:glycosyltransferase, partial [Vibrio sp. 10N.222.51.C8]|uniref:glycosyltransferase n=1 Tax=Vibrio sp. 10N.222.51.C8 TaxID=3229624 RepID=UPI003550E4CF
DTIGFHFNITVPDKYYQEVFNGYEDTIINLGPIKNRDCPKIYQQCHAMILPTLVECFSASYPEAMKMERPILTSNYPFASTVCKNAALYFNAHDPSDIADKIRTLAGDPDLYTSLVAAGNERLSAFLSPTERCSKYINLLYKLR